MWLRLWRVDRVSRALHNSFNVCKAGVLANIMDEGQRNSGNMVSLMGDLKKVYRFRDVRQVSTVSTGRILANTATNAESTTTVAAQPVAGLWSLTTAAGHMPAQSHCRLLTPPADAWCHCALELCRSRSYAGKFEICVPHAMQCCS
jgi:hypothetical protein